VKTSEGKKTGIFAGVAVALIGLAVLTSPHTSQTSAVFASQGTEFYPAFKDPLKAAALEVIEYDELSSAPKPFRVQVVNGQWSIPSHENYPADGKDRLAKTAASVIDLKKDRLASDNPKDYEELGVIDPLDPSAKGTKGRGKRVRIFDQAGSILADYVFGKETKENGDQRYIRVPDQKQTWAVKVKPDISVKFEDWVETDLLKFGSTSVRKVAIDKYSFDAVQQQIKDKAKYLALRDDNAAPWKVSDMKETEEANTETLTTMVSTLTGLKLTGVRKKPQLVAAAKDVGDLGKLPQNALMAVARALSGKGFFVYSEDKNTYGIICSEGEMQVTCDDGVVYTLRFGDVLVGSGDEISAAAPEEDEKAPKKDEKKDPKKEGGTENRYLMVSVRYDEALLGAPPVEPKPYLKDPAKKPEEQAAAEDAAKKAKDEFEGKKKDFDKKKTDGKKRAEELQARFAQWYYVISADAFKKLRVDRAALVKAKEVPKDEKKPETPKLPEPPKDEKKVEPPKDEKKPQAPKPEDKKPDEKKADEKKAETPKPPDEKPKPPDEKKP
jgi:hypothetical protein